MAMNAIVATSRELALWHQVRGRMVIERILWGAGALLRREENEE
jgi:hypothetical protein